MYPRGKGKIPAETGREINDSIINEVLQKGTADIDEENLKIIREASEEYVRNIFRKLREHGYDEKTMNLCVSGGGGCLSVAMTRQQFDHQLMMLGYRYARNGNYAHPSIIAPGWKRPVSPLLRDEVRKLDKYNEQIRLLAGFEIETGEELLSFIEETGEKIKELENERQKIYNKIRRVKTPDEEEKLKQRAKDISAEIAPLRKRKKTAEEIAENIPKIKELLKTEMDMELSVLQKENIRQRSRER